MGIETNNTCQRPYLVNEPGGVERLGRHQRAHAVLVPAGAAGEERWHAQIGGQAFKAAC